MQHPGGLMICPQEYEIYDFTPIQYPANDKKKSYTTHFDYHVIHNDLVKLDALGHDTPTIVKYLHDFSGIDPSTVDLTDKNVMQMFKNVSCFNIKEEDVLTDIGTAGIPEYNTMFIRQMLKETQVSTFADLVRINGWSHGKGIWIGNMRDMFLSGKASLNEMIASRDDIMNYLISKGMDKRESFFIMEKVRKGKGLTEEEAKDMKEHGVPDWYIDACNKITYMFPLSHSCSYTIMSYRIAWFKYYKPLAFYAAIFSIKSDEFKHEMLAYTDDDIRNIIKRYQSVRKLDVKDKKKMQILELYLEFRLRGFKMKDIDVNRSDSFKFIPIEEENSLLVPFSKLSGLGGKTAQKIVDYRKENGSFKNIKQLKKAGINKTVLAIMEERCITKDLNNDDEQLMKKLF
jgi:DNA polymerase-3 subunit alpha (Gram-positive type)